MRASRSSRAAASAEGSGAAPQAVSVAATSSMAISLFATVIALQVTGETARLGSHHRGRDGRRAADRRRAQAARHALNRLRQQQLDARTATCLHPTEHAVEAAKRLESCGQRYAARRLPGGEFHVMEVDSSFYASGPTAMRQEGSSANRRTDS